MKQTFLLIPLFLVSVASAYVGSLSSEAKIRRESCKNLIEPINSSSDENSGGSGGSGVTGSNESGCVCGGNDGGSGVTGSNKGGCVCNQTDVTLTATPVTLGTDATSLVTDSASGYNCTLIIYFYEIGLKLTEDQYELWIKWIQEIQITILVNSSLSYEQKIVQISYSLQDFFKENVDFLPQLFYASLGSWGTVVDFIYIGYEINIDHSAEVVTIDGSGSCTLFEALRNATLEDSEKSVEVQSLIEQILKIFSYPWSQTQQQAQIYLLFQAFFKQHSEWISFFYSIQIEGFGSFQYYYDAISWYYLSTTISVAISGSTSECLLLTGLNAAWQDTRFTIEVRNQIKQLYEKLVVKFESATELSWRLAYLTSQYYKLYSFSPNNSFYVNLVQCGSWGPIYNLLFVSQICINYGCGDLDDGPGTLAPESTTLAVETSTVPVVVPANCNTCYSVIEIDENNQTAITTALDKARLTWSASYRSSANTYINLIKKAIWGSYSVDLTFQYVIGNCTSFNGNNPPKQELFFSTYIVEWQGTIQQLIGCSK